MGNGNITALILSLFMAVLFSAVIVAVPACSEKPRPHLAAALDAARWLESVAVETEAGKTWPTDPAKPSSSGGHLYSGSPGVVLFYLELHHATGDPAHLEEAAAGARALAHEVMDDSAASTGPSRDPGLYTGDAGIAFVLHEAYKATGDAVFKKAALHAAENVHKAANQQGAGVEWKGVTDIIGGGAGIGLFLLHAAREMDHRPSRELAYKAGKRLLEVGIETEAGMKWRMSPGYERLMPNFSHGTAGVAYFLAALHEEFKEEAFLEGALAGARYLQSVTNDRGLIFHHEPGGEDLFYLGWCHGPAGTGRLYLKLWEVTGDQAWLEAARRAAKGVMESGIPEQRTPGFWNTVGQCCGNAGVAEFFLDLHGKTSRGEYLEFAKRLNRDIMARATRDEQGLHWVQAEHRVRPELLIAQTGYMQGAAGIGIWLLHLDGFEQGRSPAFALPDRN